MADYTVQPGDTLWKIARDNGTTVAQIMADNPQIKGDGHWIFPGDVFKIQTPEEANPPQPAAANPVIAPQPEVKPEPQKTDVQQQQIQEAGPYDYTVNASQNEINPADYVTTDVMGLFGKSPALTIVGYDASQVYDDVIPYMTVDGMISERVYNDQVEFDKYRIPGPRDFYETGYAFVFFTTPSLNLVPNATDAANRRKDYSNYNITTESFFMEMDQNEPYVLSQLCIDKPGSNPFIPLLTNRARSFDPQDTTLKTKTWGENLTGYKLLLPDSQVDSLVDGNFSVAYTEDDNLSVTKIHKAWTLYIESARKGRIFPAYTNIITGTLDYLSSVYYFTLKPDGMTINYYAKFTGVAPTGVPYSAFNWHIGDHNAATEITVPYLFTYKEDLNPDILTDFMTVAGGEMGNVRIRKRVKKDIEPGKPIFDYLLVFDNDPFTSIK